MLTGIDHIAIAVDDLDTAGRAFEAAGFRVTPGGSHPTGTHNALIPFADGTYLELIAIEDPVLGADHPWFQRMAGKQGFVAFAVAADPLDYELARLASMEIISVNSRDGARQRPDGQQLRWKSSDLASDPPVFLPFLIQDVTERRLRVPSGKETDHPNGVQGTTGLTILTEDLESARAAYGKLFSAPMAALDHGFEGVQQSWRYTCGQNWIDLIQSLSAGSPLAGYFATYGAGIYQISLTVENSLEFPPNRIDIPGFPDLHVLVTN